MVVLYELGIVLSWLAVRSRLPGTDLAPPTEGNT